MGMCHGTKGLPSFEDDTWINDNSIKEIIEFA